jgi:prepilin-type N-terminal cleavage/methylation domain-containing protein
MNKNFKQQINAFTLAEVLITLLIVGVVASLVIPALINDTREAEFKAGAKKAFSEIANVVNQVKMDYGTLNGFIGNNRSFKPVFINYFSILKDCGWETCVPASSNSNIYTGLSGMQADTGGFGGEGQFVTSDGMFISIQNSANASYGIIILADVNGYEKGPNVYGRDAFVFQLLNDVLVPMGVPGTLYSNRCSRSSLSTVQGCTCGIQVLSGTDY